MLALLVPGVGMGGGTAYSVTPPLYLVTQQVHTAGSVAEDVFVAGEVAQQVHTAGSVSQ